MTLRRAILIAIAALSLVACGDDDASNNANNANNANNVNNVNNANNANQIEVAGTWDSNFDTTEVIDADAWNGYELTQYDNDARMAITVNAEDDEFFPGAYTKIVWTPIEADTFYYCMVAFGQETEQEAVESEDTSDATDPETTGCGDFPWTKLTRQ